MFLINLLQTEDWHSEKFEVSLMENLPLTSVLSRLDHAKDCIKTILPGATPMFLGTNLSHGFQSHRPGEGHY
jgi:hypothetical protein